MGINALSSELEQYREWVSKLETIPTLPVVAMKVNELINDPRSSSQEIAALLKKDQALTAKILRLVNSSYYSIPGGVTEVQRALAYLGFNTVAQIVLGLSVVGIFKKTGGNHFKLEDFWKHAIAVAVIAEMIGKEIQYPRPEELFTCGLLHDVGKLVLHEIDGERLTRITEETQLKGLSFVEVERSHSLPGHAFLGEQIAQRWGLPPIIRATIHYHHHNVWPMDSLMAHEKIACHTVGLANLIAVKNCFGNSGDYSSPDLPPESWLKPIEMNESQFENLLKNCPEQIDRAGAFLNA